MTPGVLLCCARIMKMTGDESRHPGLWRKREPGTLHSFHAVFVLVPLFTFPTTRLSTNF